MNVCFVDRSCPAPPPPPENLCDATTPNFATYVTTCGKLNDTAGVFGEYIAKLGVDVTGVLAENCLIDACLTNGASLCLSIQAFMDECAENGIAIPCTKLQDPAIGGCGTLIVILLLPTRLF